MFENLKVSRNDAVAVVTIDRPRVLNALDSRTLDELRRALLDIKADPSVRVAIITGAGERAFVAGADINELAAQRPDESREHALRGQHVFDLVETLGKPVIAAINGFALGGGCELALACTLRVAADTARLGQPEINLGLIPGFAGTQRLARLVGRSTALDLLLTGRQITADDALRIGLVNRVVPAAELMDTAMRLAADLAGKPPIAARYILEAVHQGLDVPLRQGQLIEATLFGLAASTDDMREGTAAFLEKRLPVFKGTQAAAAVDIMDLQGSRTAAGCRFAIVVSRFNDEITAGLLQGAREALSESGVNETDVSVVRVPGAFELPVAARRIAEAGEVDAVICLGCLIKGETMHFEYIASAASQGIMDASTATGVPVAFGLLTALTDEQAAERAAPGAGNKGREAALAAVEMATLFRFMDEDRFTP